MAMTNGQRLLAWRTEHQLSQAAAAALLKPPSTQAAWSDWEADKKEPTLDSAFALEELTKGSVKAKQWATKRRSRKAA